MKAIGSSARRIRRRIVATMAVLIFAVGAMVAVAGPAAASTWTVISQYTSCYTYSFGTLCTVHKTSLRNEQYCTRPPISNPWASISWSTYCVRYSETTYWK